MEKRKFRMPTAYTILFLLIVAVAVATRFIPAGSYDYVDGVPQAGTYHTVEPDPAGVGDVLIAPFAYAIGSGWEATCQLGPKALVLVHMPDRENDPQNLWQQVEATVRPGQGPAVYIPNLGQRMKFAQ